MWPWGALIMSPMTWSCDILGSRYFVLTVVNRTWMPNNKNVHCKHDPPNLLGTRLLQNDILHWFTWGGIYRKTHNVWMTIMWQPILFSLMSNQIFKQLGSTHASLECRSYTIIQWRKPVKIYSENHTTTLWHIPVIVKQGY